MYVYLLLNSYSPNIKIRAVCAFSYTSIFLLTHVIVNYLPVRGWIKEATREMCNILGDVVRSGAIHEQYFDKFMWYCELHKIYAHPGEKMPLPQSVQ